MRESAAKIHYPFLDGLRGLAALFVLFHHVRMADDPWAAGSGWPSLLEHFGRVLDFGHYAVGVFIVLSGFCLMLPIVQSGEGQLRGGARGYLLRRARRILPPYYAALAGSLALFALLPWLRVPTGARFDAALPVFTPGVILSHLFLMHDFQPDWLIKINPPMWSVAIEWHIYFLLPWVLLPLWRKIGLVPVVLGATMLGIASHFLFHERLDFVSPQYLALFSAGMSAAVLSVSPPRLPWNWVAGAAAFAGTIYFAALPGFAWSRAYVSDLVVGGVTATFIVLATQRRMRWLETRPVVWLGSISYSLYLVHYPVVRLLAEPIQAAGFPPAWRFLALLTTGTAASLLVACVFHRLFELPWQKARAARAIPIAAEETAPVLA